MPMPRIEIRSKLFAPLLCLAAVLCLRYRIEIEPNYFAEVLEPVPQTQVQLWEQYGHIPSNIIIGRNNCEVVYVYEDVFNGA